MVSLIHLRGPGESLQDLRGSSRHTIGNADGQVWGGHGPLSDRRDTGSWSHAAHVWASRSHTQTSHLNSGVSISVCAPGQTWSLSRFIRVGCWQKLVRAPGIGRWCHTVITGSTQWWTLHFHVFFVIIFIVISLLVGILTELWVTINIVWLEDGRVLGPIQINQAMSPIHFILPWLWIMARWDFWESTALPEQPVGKDYVRIDEGGGDHGYSQSRQTTSSYSWS